MGSKRARPRCIIIAAGPNGSGKTTFARDYLSSIAGMIHFINAELIAGGISPLSPALAAVTAGRVVLRELDRLVESRAEFAFESTLSGLQYARADVLRRFKRSWVNFRKIYQPLSDRWAIYENSQASPRLLERGP